MSATALILCTVLGFAWRVDRFGVRERAHPADVLVVLGARVRPSGEPSLALRARVEKAVALYRAGVAPRLLFSGGVGSHPPSEARAAATLAVSLGVPPEACVLEEDSHSTAENARLSAEVLRRLGATRVVVVSDPYHLLRARQLFRLHGFEVGTSPALQCERHTHLLSRLRWTLRESAALLLSPRVLLASASSKTE
ncbi:MAG: YdcF family protein [Myxococcaceae bacterium]|nr:YdcF family protein [Myxococcaceae bacterium]